MLPSNLKAKLTARIESDALRTLPETTELIDFSSNDYLGFSRNKHIYDRAHGILKTAGFSKNGATGSRLLSGNHPLYKQAEIYVAEAHHAENALIFNSGYDANVGFFASVPQRGDYILYDEFAHASIRDGIQLSNAKAYKFRHNDLLDLKRKLSLRETAGLLTKGEIYVVTESVFSMDGDSPELKALANLCAANQCHLVVDEAHALGILGSDALGLIPELQLENQVFARIITFGKALGCHGAAVLGSADLKSYLVNFARSLIYTTALPPHAIATILAAHETLLNPKKTAESPTTLLFQNINFFKTEAEKKNLASYFISSDSAIQSAVIPGNSHVKNNSRKLKEAGFDVKPILSPTVPDGQERLRFCLHSFNTKAEISHVLKLLQGLINK